VLGGLTDEKCTLSWMLCVLLLMQCHLKSVRQRFGTLAEGSSAESGWSESYSDGPGNIVA
jgi:hypothetical protein